MSKHRKDKSIWPSFQKLRESTSERALRQSAQAQARKRSENIDRAIEEERLKLRAEPKTKILLLGPSESGKSTILKNFQMAFSPTTFRAQVDSWLPIIYLNVVRMVNSIIESVEFLDCDSDSLPYIEGGPTASTSMPTEHVPIDLQEILSRLKQLRIIEAELDMDVYRSQPSTTFSSPAVTRPSSPTLASTSRIPPDQPGTLKRHDISRRASSISIRPGVLRQRLMDHHTADATSPSLPIYDRARRFLEEHAPDMVALWTHDWTHEQLEAREVHPEYQSGFFLDDLPRICSPGYRPTAEDILRARTVHAVLVDIFEAQPNSEWIIYDVGGGRSQRAAWAQYFEDVTAVLYVASLSAFDETLAEDVTVNRLTDSLLLWQTLCSNKLLSAVDFVLLLNKMDLLESKLLGNHEKGRAGIRFVKHVNSFKSRPNDLVTVAKYMQEMFLSLHRQHSPSSRKVYSHLACAIDAPRTSPILEAIQTTLIVRTSTL
ncbi:P-loop containing nucleoside triphosphate hydrolase [Pleurotus pulmonarius]